MFKTKHCVTSNSGKILLVAPLLITMLLLVPIEAVAQDADYKEEITETSEQTITELEDSQHQNIDSDPLSEGSEGQEVLELKNKLNVLGYTTNSTEYFDEETIEAIKRFQENHELEVSGIVDIKTLDLIDTYYTEHYETNNDQNFLEDLPQEIEKTIPQNESKQAIQKAKNSNLDITNTYKEEKESDNVLRKGIRAKTVIQLKNDLALVGFPVPGNGNDYFGPQTERQVRAFQKANGLAENGIADAVTLEKIESALNSPLSIGMRRSDVVELKRDLAKAGFLVPGSGNNYFGPQTEQQVKAFQRFYNLEINGLYDKETENRLQILIHSSLQYGVRAEAVVQLKKDLAIVGYPVPGSGNNYYGHQTEQQVKAFQKAKGLAENGIADAVTLEKIQSSLNSPLSIGMRRADVVELKRDLAKVGFPVPGSGNNFYGVQTELQVKAFQKAYNLDINGQYDESTQVKLEETLGSFLQMGKRNEEVVQLKKDLALLGFPISGNGNNYFGSQTELQVKAFQNYYGLVVNGIIDSPTKNVIKTTLGQIYQYGDRSLEIKKLKQNLIKIGFWSGSNPTTLYGVKTEQAINDFQSYYNLIQNGTVDTVTKAKIKSIINSPYQLGKRSSKIRKLKTDLMELGFAPQWSKPNDYYGPETAQIVKEFQRAYRLPISGIIEESTYNLIKNLQNSKVNTSYNITFNDALNIQMKVNPQTDKNYAYVSAAYVDSKGKVTAKELNIRAGAGKNKAIIGSLAKGEKVKIISKVNDWYQIEYIKSAWVDAVRSDVSYYLNPLNFVNDRRQKFQFLNLLRLSGATISELNSFLQGKGILQDMGQAFLEAGRLNGVNEVYLLSHALLETGHGTSKLARGIKVNGVTVYNMFGIGAYDENPDYYGSLRAYEEGWTTPEKAIVGGAQFIGNNYVKAGQNTLYKMRWNPEAMVDLGKASHQYATDMGWAYKQVNTIYNLYRHIGINGLYLDIPVYQ